MNWLILADEPIPLIRNPFGVGAENEPTELLKYFILERGVTAMGVVVAAAVGSWFIWLIIVKGLSWARRSL